MPPKRKHASGLLTSAAARVVAHAKSDNGSREGSKTTSGNTSTSQTEAGSREGTPRRSSRRLQAERKTDSPLSQATPTNTSSGTEKARPAPSNKRRKVQKDSSSIQDGVRMVMRELSEMEQRLQNETKRQREAVKNSHLAIGSDIPEQLTYGFPTSKAAKKRKEEQDHHTLGPDMPGQLAYGFPTKAERQRKEEEVATVLVDSETLPLGGGAAAVAISDIMPEKVEEDVQLPDRGPGRPPAVNSDYLPLPWKGRLGYACLNTYLRNASPPVFSSRTCRIASIIEHRHPLADPSQPEHPTKNRPDRTRPAEVKLGERWVQELGLANARDIVKMLRWNERYGIRFLRLSSEMFPFASHAEYGYTLAPFASDVLAEAGRVAGELGHRLTTHPGQFTQLGSPRPEVITAAVRDLAYHDELLTLLRLPEQQDRDAVMILHMGGTYGDKTATLARFRLNHALLPESVRRRLVLENDDVGWSVHDLLPVCEELDIPLVLDWHHHNIVFDAAKVREGTADAVPLLDRILATWKRKGITPKMHYSEPCAGAVTARDRRKHSPRVRTLPPCPPDTDLMIEAKDKEQAVFELMRTFRLPGFELIGDVVPHERGDENRVVKGAGSNGKKKAAAKKGVKKEEEEEVELPAEVAAEDVGMGGPQGHVYWPEGFEDWLRPKKREPVNAAKCTKFPGDESN